MTDFDPFAPRHIGSALSVTGLVGLMVSETPRPDILVLACACLAGSLVAFTVAACSSPQRRRPGRTRRPAAPRPITVDWEAAPMGWPTSGRPQGAPVHPALSSRVRTLPPALPKPAPPPPPPGISPTHRRALKDVRNRRIARGP